MGSPYGDGGSSARIVDILKNLNIDDRLLQKKLTF
jgi:UDP-N-acetylglucosamine 2-epimerase